jgi:hypothetical protein
MEMTMAYPICEFEKSVRTETKKAQAETEFAMLYSRERETRPVQMTLRLAFTALLIKSALHSLARNQRLLIAAYQGADFTNCSAKKLLSKANSLDWIVSRGRRTLAMLEKFGRIKKLWEHDVPILEEQLDHFESIAMSLRMSADPEVNFLMSLAVEQMAV